jgi:hypothetical protein
MGTVVKRKAISILPIDTSAKRCYIVFICNDYNG